MWDGCGSQTATPYLNRAHNSSGRIYYPLLIFLVSWEKNRGCFWCDWLQFRARHDERKPVNNNIWWPASRRPIWTHIHKESQGCLCIWCSVCLQKLFAVVARRFYGVVNMLGGCYVVLCCCKCFGWLLGCCYVVANNWVITRCFYGVVNMLGGCYVVLCCCKCFGWLLGCCYVVANNWVITRCFYGVVNMLGGCYVVLCCCKCFGWLLGCCYVVANNWGVTRVLICAFKCFGWLLGSCYVVANNWGVTRVLVCAFKCFGWLLGIATWL